MHSPTQEERRRWLLFRDLGCIACILEGAMRDEWRGGTPADVHHEVHGYRVGHDRTVPLCPWHHRGVPTWGASDAEMRDKAGPSLALHPAEFKDRYGTFDDLFDATEAALRKLQVETALDTMNLPIG